MFKKVIATMLLTGLILSSFAGCKGGDTPSVASDIPSGTSETATSTSSGESSEVSTSTDVAYPIAGSPKLTYFVNLNPNIAKTVSNLGETPFAAELAKQTGVEVEYIHPPQGQEKEQFNIMVASGDLPDIIDYQWKNYPGGVQKAMNDGVLIPLNDAYTSYSPDIVSYLAENPALDKDVKTDDGDYFMYPQFTNDVRLSSVYGIIARGDWMDELAIDSPETLDEMYIMLKRFKEEKGATAPFTFNFTSDPFKYGMLAGGYDVKNEFYLEDGKTVYGPIQPGYKDFLIEMNKWYTEGLLDNNFAVIDGTTIDAKMLNGESGATFGYAGAHIGNYMSASEDPNFKIYGISHMATEKGATPEFGSGGELVMNSGAAITTKCEDVETAARFLNYGYTEAGHVLMNFGIEGESFTMVDGKPTYTDLIMNNPDGYTISQAMGRYIRASYSGPFDKDYGYQEQYQALPVQQEAIVRWSNSNKMEHLIPWISFTPEESDEVAKITNSVKTLTEEMTVKFITGTSPIEEYDKYVEQVKQLNIDIALAHYDEAIERYSQR